MGRLEDEKVRRSRSERKAVSSGPDSDMDIAIIFEDFSDSSDMQVALMKLRRKFDTKIEPNPFRATDFNFSNPIAIEILKTGLEIV